MTPQNLSLVHLIQPPKITLAKSPLFLLLHGYGSNEADLFSLAAELDDRFFVVSARAPLSLGYGAHAWFHLDFTPGGLQMKPEEAERSRLLLLKFIGELAAQYPVDASNVFIAGFSQGAILALSVALTEPEKVAGVVAMSGRLPPEKMITVASSGRLTNLPVLISHGISDPVIPVSQAREAKAMLETLPVNLTYREYPMGHTISARSLADISLWLTARLGAAAKS
ncbi:MAG: alpha/beta fold hydrolase [Rhizobacter sp.]|nr:alpha/beta fold hydrolase [Chlorobiales bacterium]